MKKLLDLIKTPTRGEFVLFRKGLGMKLLLISVAVLLSHFNNSPKSLLWYLAAAPVIYAVLMLGVVEERIAKNRLDKSD